MRALLGRDDEGLLVDDTIASARVARGRALFVTGEAGIGKSAVLALARARASAAGAHVLAGASWESDGAPPYWPWLQVLRAAADDFGARVRDLPGAARIAALVPEWGHAGAGAPDDAPDPAAARFALLDAVARGLVALSAHAPLVILLDDLHAADAASLDLLSLLVRELPRASIALVGAWREGELASRTDAAQRIARAARHATVRPLRRLTSAEVASWAERAGGDAGALFTISEGNPLFIEEALRAGGRVSLTGGVAAAIRDHLALLSPATAALLAVASVLGRDFDRAALRALAIGDDDLAVALREAIAAGAIEPRGDDRWAFTHVLVRDHLYESLPPSRRAALHRAAGRAIDRADPSGARAAHHLLAGAGADDAELDAAIAAARTAAARAAALFAFEDAAALLAAARRALDAVGRAADPAALDLAVDLAGARIRAGQVVEGQADAVRAADLARRLGSAELLARAALVYATELLDGRRDPQMIALLEEALRALPPEDSALRARVMARLGAALAPPPDPEDPRPDQLTTDAVAMARRIGDDVTVMFALRYQTHAKGYRSPARECLEVATEVIAFSDLIGRPFEALEQRTWLIGGRLMLGDRVGAIGAADQLFALLDRLPQPHYRWRAPILRGVLATLRGEFVDAARHIAIACEIAADAGLGRAVGATIFARLGLAAASQSAELAAALVEDLRRVAAQRVHGLGVLAWALARAGRLDEARIELDRTVFVPVILVQYAAEAIVLLGGHPHAELALDTLTRAATLQPMVNGPAGSALLCPAAIAIGELSALLGRIDEAIEPFECGLALARAIEAPPFVARGAAGLAEALRARGRAGDRARARALADEAMALFRGMNVHSASGGGTSVAVITESASGSGTIDSRTPAAPPTPGMNVHSASGDRSAPDTLSLRRDGALVHVAWRARVLVVPASKGTDYLVQLVAAPGREIHVADLVGDDDRGDAGEVIDTAARDAYRERAEDLRAELQLARDRNDVGRAERLGEELDALAEQLAAGVGLGGRSRRAASRVERARINVQRRIRDAIRRLAAEDEALGRYLDAAVATGTFCSFTPLT